VTGNPGNAVGLSRALLDEEFFDRQLVGAPAFLETDGAVAHRLTITALRPETHHFVSGDRKSTTDLLCDKTSSFFGFRSITTLRHDNSIVSQAAEERDRFFQMQIDLQDRSPIAIGISVLLPDDVARTEMRVAARVGN
jgi:hypothetical protein